MSDKMIFESAGKYCEKKVEEGHKVFDLFICPWCAGTLQSITAHAFAFGLGILPFEFNWQLLIRWPLVIFGTSLLSGIVWTVYQSINSFKENMEFGTQYYNNAQKYYYNKNKEVKEKNGKPE